MPLPDLLQQLDPHPDIRGRQFERICKWYLQSAPEYRRRFRRVWLWKDWPDAWAPDAGIDLVAEQHDGGLWAIQAKAYGESYAIKKADVDSFLAESSRTGFTYRLLIATTDRLGPTARRTLDDQREPVGYLLRSQLELARVEWPASPDQLRPRRPARKKPFPHVKEAIRATVKGFKDIDRGQLIILRHRQDAGGDVDRRAPRQHPDADPRPLAVAAGPNPGRGGAHGRPRPEPGFLTTHGNAV